MTVRSLWVAGNTSQSTLKQAGVWPGLSKLVEKEGEYEVPASKRNSLFIIVAFLFIISIIIIVQSFRVEENVDEMLGLMQSLMILPPENP